MKRFVVFAGNYGSGKTEISLNTVLEAEGKRILLDMDIVNPYFRSSEHEELLRSRGIDVVKPCFANTASDVPSLPGEIYQPFGMSYDLAVFDAGGDPVGATALGCLSDKFDAVKSQLDVYYVINANRPLQEKCDNIVDMLRVIERVSKLKVTGLVSNSNLAGITNVRTVVDGHELVRQVSDVTQIPIAYVAARADIIDDVKSALPGYDYIPLNIYTRPDWLDED